MAKHEFYLSRLEQDLLTLLKGHNGFYGLEMLAIINQVRSSCKIQPLTKGSFYTTLNRMESQGFIISVTSKQEKTPLRRYYAISTDGAETLNLMEQYRERLADWYPPK